MPVVSNTSPLSNLAIIGQLEQVRKQLGEILIPPAVRAELSKIPHNAAHLALEHALGEGWIRMRALTGHVPPDLAAVLDSGEAEVLALATEAKASLVLLDEAAARHKALNKGFAITGALGILRRAKQLGRITSLKEQIARLRTDARFFIHPALERALLISVGE